MPLLPKAGRLRTFKFPGKQCPICHKQLSTGTSTTEFTTATCLSSGQLYLVRSRRTRCNSCRTSLRCNFMWLGDQKINCVSFNQLKAAGVFFASQKTAFTMEYLHLCYLRLLRAKTSPGQEAAVRLLASADHPLQFWQEHSLRDHLLHALEGYVISQSSPDEIIEYNLDFPAQHCVKFRGPEGQVALFPPEGVVTAVSFDGHFGVHRRLLPGVDPARTVKLKGKPRKVLEEFTRSSGCKHKDATRKVLPDRTAGWQFDIDPISQSVLGATEHIVNERNTDKVRLLQAVLAMPNMKVDLLLHDDACHFQDYVEKHKEDGFDAIKFYIIDEFHRRNHTCKKRRLTKREVARSHGVRTNMSEIFNAWLRPLNFFLNGLRPHSHKFWVLEVFGNANHV